MLRIGVDVGGTFTDLVAHRADTGQVVTLKLPSLPDQQERAVLAGVSRLASGGPQLSSVVHGTTVVTNALLEGRVARVGLVTTRGFRDVLEIGRQSRVSLYDLRRPGRPEPLAPRRWRFEVEERLGPRGEVLQPLRPEAIERCLAAVRESGVEAVAVALLHSYANPSHEQRLVEALRQVVPYVCASSEINAEFREFERTSTAVLNAAVMPLADHYLERLERSLEELAERPRLHLVQSSGGMLSTTLARAQPLRLIMSGPAAGVAAARWTLRNLDLADAVTFDMGGTSTDVCLIAGGVAETARERRLDDRPLRAVSVAVESIGAGGGSLAWIDSVGALKVGPRSAGARPGPAAYGLGGEEPTVTDANVVLGYIRPGLVFGETIRIDQERAREAVARVARPLGLSIDEAARGILEIADAAMRRAIQLVSVQKGYDLRRFTLVAFGGAGPLHAGRLAQRLGIPRVLVPAHSSVYSAFGCLVSDLRYDTVQTYRARLSRLDVEELERRFLALEQEARRPLESDGVPADRVLVQRSLDLRYAGQNYELEVPLDDGRAGLDPARIRAGFQRLHRARYTYDTDEDVECVNLRLVASVPSTPIQLPAHEVPNGGAPLAAQRAYFPELGWAEIPVYARDALGREPISGPALVEDAQSTLLVLPGQRAHADRWGNFVLETAP